VNVSGPITSRLLYFPINQATICTSIVDIF
jgi:hypothetical protein